MQRGKRSDETQTMTTKTRAQLGASKNSVVSRGGGGAAAADVAARHSATANSTKTTATTKKLAQTQIEDEIGIANEHQSNKSASGDSSSSSNRLVFGLNPRANKLKHDEYVERRAKQYQLELLSGGNKSDQAGMVVANSSQTARETKKVLVRQRSESPERRKVTSVPVSGASSEPSPEVANEQPARTSTRRVRREDKYKKRDTSPASIENSNNKTSPKMPTTSETSTNQTSPVKTVEQNSQSSGSVQQPPARMQFNIPPPPKVNSGSVTKSSIISYAKSRIYDKQQQFQQSQGNKLAQQQASLSDALHDSTNIPESILSGFKPPKQVNVSKARERWEGGEPFARCKSRQRLAQSANKKVLYGTWSMTSVVATQQLQFQQALAQSQLPKSTSSSNSLYPNDTPVKILTRGSVLERVQQYEQVPASMRSNGSLSSSTGSLSSSSSSSSSTSSSSSNTDDLGSLSPPVGSSPDSPFSGPSKPATATPVPITGGGGVRTQESQKSPQPDQISAALNRRFSFRRRSSTSSAIPKFYHPNGKPNTYEIELQKKNIVACFDKFTDRKALLTAPAYKRHFHSIALACGFSEYFKEPLYRYIRHQMTSSSLLHQTNGAHPASLARKQSTLGPPSSNGMISSTAAAAAVAASNGSGPGKQRPISLTRAASIDNSTVEKIQNQNYITCDQFLTCWRHLISTCFDNPARFVHLLTLGQRQHLLPEDFVPLVQSVIDDHPGLKFLRSAPDFHMRYIQTVIARIYFCLNRSWTGKLSLSELRRSNLLQTLEKLAREEDINQVTEYFSYEHFYVIYCKFWSLDQDHDLLISKEDLARHNDAAISSRIIDRIFTGVVSKRIQETGKMSYSDFVWFLLAEENKKHARSIEYWFRLMDIDGDGYISMYEMEYFYYEQMKRLELMNIEALPFLDSACQILDLVNPREQNKITLSDLKRTKLVTIFFDTFINIEKYLEHESREFASSRDCIVNGQVVSDWDRYASEAYESLVTEESTV